MKVYIVFYVDYDQNELEVVFSSLFLAEQYINFHTKGEKYKEHLYIQEERVLEALPE